MDLVTLIVTVINKLEDVVFHIISSTIGTNYVAYEIVNTPDLFIFKTQLVK